MKKYKAKFRFTIRRYVTIVILIDFTLALIISSGMIFFLDHVFGFPVEIPIPLLVVLMSIILGGSITGIFSKKFLSPITQLSKEMENVAAGDFSIRLETESQINEIRDIYSNFNVMVKELASTEMLQSDFVSNVSHEFKTPINAIEGYAMLLQGDPQISEEQTEYIEKILFNTKRLSGLVGNILLLSKIENQTIPANKETFRLDEQIRQAIVLLEPKWSEKEIDFDVDMERTNFLGNESLLFHVWLNLISNAIKFDPYGGVVRIRLIRRNHSIYFIIQDNGPGIDEEQQKRMFDKFYQADSSHKDEGNGLGLALVRRIVDISNGTVEVQNMAEGGCRFTVTLPTS